jgi:hypothetical protein
VLVRLESREGTRGKTGLVIGQRCGLVVYVSNGSLRTSPAMERQLPQRIWASGKCVQEQCFFSCKVQFLSLVFNYPLPTSLTISKR